MENIEQISPYDIDELELREKLELFLSNTEATYWFQCCYHSHIKMALLKHGQSRFAFIVGTNGKYGLRPEIKERRTKINKYKPTKQRKKNNTSKKLDQLLKEFT